MDDILDKKQMQLVVWRLWFYQSSNEFQMQVSRWSSNLPLIIDLFYLMLLFFFMLYLLFTFSIYISCHFHLCSFEHLHPCFFIYFSHLSFSFLFLRHLIININHKILNDTWTIWLLSLALWSIGLLGLRIRNLGL